jgi:hypothetical protein
VDVELRVDDWRPDSYVERQLREIAACDAMRINLQARKECRRRAVSAPYKGRLENDRSPRQSRHSFAGGEYASPKRKFFQREWHAAVEAKLLGASTGIEAEKALPRSAFALGVRCPSVPVRILP